MGNTIHDIGKIQKRQEEANMLGTGDGLTQKEMKELKNMLMQNKRQKHNELQQMKSKINTINYTLKN